jgi:predicted nuclease with TOPRIM domain
MSPKMEGFLRRMIDLMNEQNGLGAKLDELVVKAKEYKDRADEIQDKIEKIKKEALVELAKENPEGAETLANQFGIEHKKSQEDEKTHLA